MNIVQINSFDVVGGAAVVSNNLHQAYRKAGHSSKMLVGIKFGDDADVLEVSEIRGSLKNRLKRIALHKFEELSGLQYFFMKSADYLLGLDIIKNADIVHVHNTHGGYLNLSAVAKLSEKKPVVWTLHDMWPLTGHCAHSIDCERWKTGCGRCPDLKRYPRIALDTTRLLWRIKARAYKKSGFIITTPSEWLKEKVSESMLSGFAVRLVPNAVEMDIFRPKDKYSVRSSLGLPSDRFIAVFTAESGSMNPWKGFDYLVNALSILKSSGRHDPFLILIGDKEKFAFESIGMKGLSVGYIKDAKMIAQYNNAADVYLSPSIAENSPLVVLEALACGTPVVAFDVGGVPEIVRHKETGYIAGYKSADDFAQGIEWIMGLDAEEYGKMSRACAGYARKRHGLKEQASNFLELYEEAREQFLLKAGKRKKAG